MASDASPSPHTAIPLVAADVRGGLYIPREAPSVAVQMAALVGAAGAATRFTGLDQSTVEEAEAEDVTTIRVIRIPLFRGAAIAVVTVHPTIISLWLETVREVGPPVGVGRGVPLAVLALRLAEVGSPDADIHVVTLVAAVRPVGRADDAIPEGGEGRATLHGVDTAHTTCTSTAVPVP